MGMHPRGMQTCTRRALPCPALAWPLEPGLEGILPTMPMPQRKDRFWGNLKPSLEAQCGESDQLRGKRVRLLVRLCQ